MPIATAWLSEFLQDIGNQKLLKSVDFSHSKNKKDDSFDTL